MIITKKQLRKAIERSRIHPALRHYVFQSITGNYRRWMWETELIRMETTILSRNGNTAPTFSKTIHHDCETHNTDHAV